MGIHLKDIIEGTCRKSVQAEQDENGKNISTTYQKKLGSGYFVGDIDLIDNNSVFYCDASEKFLSGYLPLTNVKDYSFILKTDVVDEGESRSERIQTAVTFEKTGTQRKLIRARKEIGYYPWIEIPTDDTLEDFHIAFTTEDSSNPTGWKDYLLNGVNFLSGKLGNLFTNISIMSNNLKYLRKLIGTTDISKIADGTLSGAVSQLNTDILTLGNRCITFDSGANSNRKLTFSGVFNAIVAVRGFQADAFGAFFVQGYGVGSQRIHIAIIQAGPSVTCTVIENEESVLIRNTTAAIYGTVFMLSGTLPVIAPG